MKPLTARQLEIYQLIARYIRESGYPPTRLDICRTLGFRSPNAAEEHLRTLARKGFIELTAGASRGIRLLLDEQGAPLVSPVATAAADAAPSTAAVARQEQPATKVETTGWLEQAQTAVREWLQLPLIGRVAAGSPILAQEHVDDTFQVDPALFRQRPDYLLKVRGLSMRDAGILDGDLLAVKRLHGHEVVRNGQIVVARLGDEVTVKRYQRSADGVVLLPENPDFQPIVVAKDAALTLEGLGVGLIRNQSLM